MIVYTVKVNIKKTIESQWLDWMKTHHIKEVMNTNYFYSWKIFKILAPVSNPDESIYVIEYTAASIEKYEAYVKNESGRLQAEYTNKFEGYFSAERSVKEIIR